MSRIHVSFLAAFLAAAASVSFADHTAARSQPITIANEASAVIQIAESPDEIAFKDMLIKSSPWHVTWETMSGYSGTHKLRFTPGKDSGALNGGYFDSSSNTPPGSLDKIVVKKKCVQFITGAPTQRVQLLPN